MYIFVSLINNLHNTVDLIKLLHIIRVPFIYRLLRFILVLLANKVLSQSVVVLEGVLLVIHLVHKQVVNCRLALSILVHGVIKLLSAILFTILKLLFKIVQTNSVRLVDLLFFNLQVVKGLNWLSVQIVNAPEHLRANIQMGDFTFCGFALWRDRGDNALLVEFEVDIFLGDACTLVLVSSQLFVLLRLEFMKSVDVFRLVIAY